MLEAARNGESARFLLASIVGRHRWRLLAALVLQTVYSGIQFAGPLMLNQITKILMKTGDAQVRGRARGPAAACRERAMFRAGG